MTGRELMAELSAMSDSTLDCEITVAHRRHWLVLTSVEEAESEGELYPSITVSDSEPG